MTLTPCQVLLSNQGYPGSAAFCDWPVNRSSEVTTWLNLT